MRYRPRVTVGILISALLGLAATHYSIYRVGIHRGRARAESWIYADRQPRNQWVEYGRPLGDLLGRLGLDRGVLEMAGHAKYHSQWGQDRWVTQKVFPGVKDGYFVDIGSGHGIKDSNTKVLEDLGWSGVCVDPFPQNMETRTCKVFSEVAYSSPGRTVSFTRAGHLGGIRDHLGLWASDERLERAKTVELTTTTMDEILERAQAPRYLHYVSLDVEGAEYEVLQGLDLAKYQVGALTVEHNFEEPKRSRIREHLKKRGYKLAMSMKYDDWYLPARGPSIHAGGVVEAAQFSATVAPGGIATLFGAELADGREAAADTPLPLEMQGARVFVDGEAAPLFFVSKGQINFQVPYGVGAEGAATVVVWHNGFYSVAETVAVDDYAPRLFSQAVTGEPIVVRFADGALITAENPARPGDVLILYVNGVGDLANPPEAGAVALASPLSVSSVMPAVTVGGAPAQVSFCGLAPGLVALVQVNIRLPDVLPGPESAELIIDFGGFASQPVKLPVTSP